MKAKLKDEKRLTIFPEGETSAWKLHSGGYCGVAKDSVGIIKSNGGCCLTRADVIALRDYLSEVISTWSEPPRKFPGCQEVDSK